MSGDSKRPGGSSSSDSLPPKPTRDAAIGSERVEEVLDRSGVAEGSGAPEHLTSERQEVGDAESSQRHPPHVARQDAEAEIQDELPSPGGVPVLPANAHGRDKLTPDEQREPMDDASMYDGRPERDKDQPPSKRLE
jgi:hypothetical protein